MIGAAVVTAVSCLTIVGLGAPGRAAAITNQPEYQLSLGDSLAVGWGASDLADGYTNLISAQESAKFPGLQVQNVACPAETTATLLFGGGWCQYPEGSQLGAAKAFLSSHLGHVAYVTIDIGLNNVDVCPNGSTIDQACVARGVTEAQTDLPWIIAGLHNAAPGIPIFGANSYDPFLMGDDSPVTPQSVDTSQGSSFSAQASAMMGSLNNVINQAYTAGGAGLVDVAGTFATTDTALSGSYDGQSVAQNLSDVCAWTHMCDSTGWGLHLDDPGEAQMAGAFSAAIDQVMADRGHGTWLADASGGVHAFGNASFFGDLTGHPLNRPIVSMTITPDDKGYWLVASDGGVFAFGDAQFYGSTGNIHLNQPVVGMATTPDGHGYWLVASDGGIFAFGDAQFDGSTGNVHLNRPVVGMAASPDGQGYWLAASDGGIFAFGDAQFDGSTGNRTLNRPIIGVSPAPFGSGYTLAASDGGVFTFGGADFNGSTGGDPPPSPMVAIGTS
jgi:GDSL-like Lipase/Acylhydrolase family